MKATFIKPKKPVKRLPRMQTAPGNLENRMGAEPTSEHDLLRTLIDNLPDYIYVKDRESRFLINNLAHVRILGATHPDEVAGRTDFDYFPKEIAEKFFADEQALMQSGQVLDCVESVADKTTGKLRWLHTTKIAWRDGSGKVIGLLGISRNITDQKRADEALRQSHDELEQQIAERTAALSQERLLLRVIINNLPDGIYAKDAAGRKILANPADLKTLRCKTEAEAIGKTDFDFFPKDVAEKFWADDQQVLQGSPVINREEFFFDESGRKRWLLTSKLPMHDQHGTNVGLIGIGRDITTQKEVAEALRQSHDQLEKRVAERTTELSQANESLANAQRVMEAMLDNIPDRIYLKDLQGRFMQCNRAVAHRVGVEDPKQVVGKTDFDFYPREKAEEFHQDEQRIIRTGEPLIHKIEHSATPNGEFAWSSVTKVPLRDKDGKVAGLVGISRNITEQKQAEEALRQSHDELEKNVAARTAELAQERLMLRTLVDNLPDGVYAKDTTGRKTMANPADLKTLRCKTEAEAVGKTHFDLFPKDVAEKFWADDQQVLLGRPVINREEYFSTKQAGNAGC